MSSAVSRGGSAGHSTSSKFPRARRGVFVNFRFATPLLNFDYFVLAVENSVTYSPLRAPHRRAFTARRQLSNETRLPWIRGIVGHPGF